MIRKTKIVCTIGPACANMKTIKTMISAGMNVARLNMSHGNYEEHSKIIKILKKAREDFSVPLAILLDLKGPEIRIRTFVGGAVELKKGQRFTLTSRQTEGDAEHVSITFKGLEKYVSIGQKILLNDGNIELEVKEKKQQDIVCVVKHGGELSNNKSINLPGVFIPMDYISEVDKLDLLFGIKQGVDLVAISFVQNAENVQVFRDFLKANNALDIKIVSKIESASGVKNIDEIVKASDGVMVARGDLGVEIEFKKIPFIQKMILEKAQRYGKFSITATQMLESMISVSRPTRAEVSDIANAIVQKSSAVMLSGETAIGVFPVRCVKVMADIARETEKRLEYETEFFFFGQHSNSGAESICYAAVASSFDLKLKAILAVSWSGKTAENIAKFRPFKRIIVGTPNVKVFNQMAILFGVEPLMVPVAENTDKVFLAARVEAIKKGLLRKGDKVVQTAGMPVGVASETNTLKIETI